MVHRHLSFRTTGTSLPASLNVIVVWHSWNNHSRVAAVWDWTDIFISGVAAPSVSGSVGETPARAGLTPRSLYVVARSSSRSLLMGGRQKRGNLPDYLRMQRLF